MFNVNADHSVSCAFVFQESSGRDGVFGVFCFADLVTFCCFLLLGQISVAFLCLSLSS